MALQDDAVFLWERRHGSRLRARPRRRPAHEAHPRERAVVAPAGRRGREPHGPGRRAEVRLPPDRHPRGRRGQARHQAPADDRGPGAGVGHARPPGRQQRPRRGQVRRVRAHRRHALQGRVDRYSIWNEPNWNTWLYPAKSAASVYRLLYTSGYNAVKAVDPQAKVLFGELAPIGGGRAIAPLKFLRDVTCSNAQYKAKKQLRAAEGRRLRDPPLPVPARAPAGAQQGRRRADRRALAPHHGRSTSSPSARRWSRRTSARWSST